MQGVPTRQELRHRRGIPILRVAPLVVHGPRECGREAGRQQRSDFRKQGPGASAPPSSCNGTGSSVDNIQGSDIQAEDGEEAVAAPCAHGDDNV
jgi:hypothetical protein